MRPPAIGIDLGTTNSAVAVVRHGKVEILANEFGDFTTPSYIAFNEVERLFGRAAKEQAYSNPRNTIYDIKRLMGRKFNDPAVQQDIKNWPFHVKHDVESIPKVVIEYKGEKKEFFAEEISAMILVKMKEIAETYLNQSVTDAVITVPAYFNDTQRQATRDAGVIAGLNVLRIINEPIAAALAFGFQNTVHTDKKKNVLVYDLGGGTFDVSILTIHKNVYIVKATAGDTHLGGVDFDNRLVEHLLTEFKDKHGKDIRGDACAMRRLLSASERAKRILSSAMQTSVELDALHNGNNFSTKISRHHFENINDDLFQATLKPVEQALSDAKLQKSEIDEIILVGGSTRVPKVQKLLHEFFELKHLNKWVNPDEAVAYGAAIQAAILNGDYSMSVFGLILQDVTALSLGIAHGDHFKEMANIIHRNSAIPAQEIAKFQTFHDNQSEMKFIVYQGESKYTNCNHCLGEFELHGIRLAKAGRASAVVSFEIDSNGILTVKATDESDQTNTSSITIQNVNIHFSRVQIKQMIEDGQKYCDEDKINKEHLTTKMTLEERCYKILNALSDEKQNSNGLISDPGKAILKYECEECVQWLKMNQHAAKEEYECRLQKINSMYAKFMSFN